MSVFPAASVTRAASDAVWPTVTVTAGGETVTAATAAASTVMRAVPDFPSLVPVMSAVPGATAVTSPDELTHDTHSPREFHGS